ncbi:outer membrane protein [Methylobacterium durans]|jgi:opacity protein-like surface antigen|uniref:Porin family protein n=1 Tax=Methylobacterium durans TaxID=2202825 RepID=A0A2U8W083_9HYPH|nr:outer membrane beta-barrel protein [Methylobacterium durans]AWN39483.1 porin family protein [Methylobacterium durans]
MARSKLQALARSLTLVASVGAPCLAQAADLLPPPPPPPVAPPIEVGGGWYLRGDVGASLYHSKEFVAYGDKYTYDNERYYQNAGYGSGAFAGVGVGYQFNAFLRGDVTGEYRFSNGFSARHHFEYDTGVADPCGCGAANLRGNVNETAKGNFDSAVVLANGYFDLGTWYGVTPFVGGGVGVAFNTISGTHVSGNVSEPLYVTLVNPVASYNKTIGAYYKSDTTTSFAWALHAGLGFDVTPNLKMEIAYRYLNLGSAKSGVGVEDCELTKACGGGSLGVYKTKSIEAHDVKVGFRYLLGGVAAAPLPPLMADYQPAPGPLVRKY